MQRQRSLSAPRFSQTMCWGHEVRGRVCDLVADSELFSSPSYRPFIYSYRAFMRIVLPGKRSSLLDTRQYAFRSQLFMVVVHKASGTQNLEDLMYVKIWVQMKFFHWVNFTRYLHQWSDNQFRQVKQWHLYHS